MQLVVVMPQMGELMVAGVIRKVLVTAGQEIAMGTPLFEVFVDLSRGAAQDCPPVFHLRVTSRERGWVRDVHAAPGTELAIGAPVLTVTSTVDEALSVPARALRVTSVTINVDPLFDE